jgi:hypothetical protein
MANFKADLKNLHGLFGPGPMRDVYLDFHLTPGKWWPFEIYLTVMRHIRTALIFDHKELGFPSIKSDGFFAREC